MKGQSLFLSFPPNHKNSNNYLPFCIWDGYLLFLTATHVIARHLLNNIHQTLEIGIWLNVNFMLLFDIISDLITAIFHREVVDLNSNYPLTRNEKTNPVSQPATTVAPTFLSINTRKFVLKRISYTLINSKKVFLPHFYVFTKTTHPHFSLYKMPSNNLKSRSYTLVRWFKPRQSALTNSCWLMKEPL